MTPVESGIAAYATPPATIDPTIAPPTSQRTRPAVNLRIRAPPLGGGRTPRCVLEHEDVTCVDVSQGAERGLRAGAILPGPGLRFPLADCGKVSSSKRIEERTRPWPSSSPTSSCSVCARGE